MTEFSFLFEDMTFINVMFLNLAYFFLISSEGTFLKNHDDHILVLASLAWWFVRNSQPGSLFDVSFRRHILYLSCISVKSITSSHHGHTC